MWQKANHLFQAKAAGYDAKIPVGLEASPSEGQRTTIALIAYEWEKSLFWTGGFPFWPLLILLTLSLLLFPVHFTLEYQAIQSVSAIPRVSLFATLYVIWVAVFWIILFGARQRARWEYPALAVIFMLIFIGFWFVKSPNMAMRYDGIVHVAGVRLMLEKPGVLIPTATPNFVYSNFPGMNLVPMILALITDVGPLEATAIALVFHLVIVTSLLYAYLVNLIRHAPLAVLATLLIVQGNIMLGRYGFYPTFWALVFLLPVLLLICKRTPKKSGTAMTVVMFLAVAAVTHVVTSLLLFFLFAVLYLIRRWRLSSASETLRTTNVVLIALSAVLPLGWQAFYGIPFFEGLTRLAESWLRELSLNNALAFLFAFANRYGGPALPLWVTGVRYFWITVVLAAGAVLGVRSLFSVRRLDGQDHMLVSGLVAVVMFTALLTLLSPGGSEFYRVILYGPFFTVPILLRYLARLPSLARLIAWRVLAVCLFALSLPTFYAHNNLVSGSVFYPAEINAGQLMGRIGDGTSDKPRIYVDSSEEGVTSFSVPNASFRIIVDPPLLKNRDGVSKALQSAIESFFGSNPGGHVFFYLSKRRLLAAEHYLQISPSDPLWTKVKRTLAEADLIYDNEVVTVFARP